MAGDLIKNKRVVFFLLLLSLILIRLNNEICFDKYPNEISFLLRRIRQSNPKFVEVAGVTLPFIGADPKDPRVPGEEAELVINERTPTLLKYLYTVALDVKQNIHGALIGEAGIGKSALVRYLAYKMQTRFFWVPMQRDTEALDLIGRYVPVVPVCACVPPSSSEDEAPPRESEEWAWIPGQVLKAIEEGGILFLDDVNLARPDQLKFFNSLLDYHSTVFTAYYGGKRHTISIHPNFRIFVAMNPTSYQGRGELGSFLKRFQTHTMEHLPREELEEILTVLVEKAAPDLKKVVKPMLDLYYFMRDNLIKIGQNKEVRSRANGQYYFSMRDLLSMLDYIKEFRNRDEPLADTFGYAAKYVFRDRLEMQIVSEREIEENPRAAYRLYDQFDEFLKSVKVDGKTPNMKKILYYENLDVDEVKAMASKSVLDWLTYLTDEVFPKTNLAKEVKKLIGLLLDDFPERNLAYYPAFTIFPEKMRDKAIEELKNFILDRSSSQMSLVDKFKATEVLIEIAEHIKTAKDSLKAIYQNISRRPIYQDPSLQLLFQAYVGSGLAKYDIEPYANFRSDLQELLISSLLKAPEVLSRKGERGDFILTQLIQSLGWLGIKNERIISSLWDLLNDVQKTPLQRATAAKVLVEMDERLKEIKELFLKLADGKKVEEEKTAGLIAELALNSKMVDQKVRQKLKELSDHTDLEIALSVLDSRLRLQLEREEAETKITQLYTQTAQRSIEERIKVALVMHKYGLLKEEEFLELSFEYFNYVFSRASGFDPFLWSIQKSVARILKVRISQELAIYGGIDKIEKTLNELVSPSGLDVEVDKLLRRFKIALQPKDGEGIPNPEALKMVITPSVLAGLESILPAIKLKHHIILVGEPAVGKSILVEFIAGLLKQRFQKKPISGTMDPAELIGHWGPGKSGNLGWTPGPLFESVDEGWFIVLEEVNIARSAVLERQNTLLDRNGYMEVPEYRADFILTPYDAQGNDKGFRMFGTMNPVYEEPETKELSPAFLNRFRVKWVRGPTAKEMVKILEERFEMEKTVAQRIVDFHIKIIKKLERGEIGAMMVKRPRFDLRDLMRVGMYLEGELEPSMDWQRKMSLVSERVNIVYNVFNIDNPRAAEDEAEVLKLIREIFK